MSDFLEFSSVSKSFGTLRAVDNVSLSIKRGEFFSLLGPSGCGKTTLLRMVAGFEQPDGGRILLDGRDITDLPPNKRRVNTIFQSYALFPHLTVRQNIAFGLQMQKRKKKEIEQEVDRMLDLVQMESQGEKKPHQISGGQKQRVAVARALVLKPEVLLLDEPLAALDLKLRQRMLMELDLIHDEVGITFVYVTHDQGEAMSLSDRIAVMNAGKIEQIGPPTEIYEAPRSSFVAAFIGDTNFFEGRVRQIIDSEHCQLSIDGFPDLICFNDKGIGEGNWVNLSIRPEKFSISHDEPPPDPSYNVAAGVVEDVIYLGASSRFWVSIGDYRVSVFQQQRRFALDERPIRWRDKVWIRWHSDDGFMLERYREADEDLINLPPEEVGETTNGHDHCEP